MEPITTRARAPIAFAGALVLIVSIAMARLPESRVAQIERSHPFSGTQAAWAYRLLVVVALAQALYGGFVLLGVERLRSATTRDVRVQATPSTSLVRVVARIAGTLIGLTIAYGVAAFIVTGARSGYWLFALLAVAQTAWYLRQVRQIAEWLERQPRRTDEIEA